MPKPALKSSIVLTLLINLFILVLCCILVVQWTLNRKAGKKDSVTLHNVNSFYNFKEVVSRLIEVAMVPIELG